MFLFEYNNKGELFCVDERMIMEVVFHTNIVKKVSGGSLANAKGIMIMVLVY